mmetsp:Transcript_50702/g.108037  ORF Transcript_50702/g.108037 Transcript_50702/m.108037 type:complete len:503 (-) Transcript_50702:120-1628(-)
MEGELDNPPKPKENPESPGVGNDDGDGIFINLTVPPGAEAGIDSLTFQYGGNELGVLVPAGSVAGDVLRIQVGFGAGAGDRFTNARIGDEADGELQPASSLMNELGGMDDDDAATNRDGQRSGGLLSESGAAKDEHGCKSVHSKRLRERDLITRNTTTRSAAGLTVVKLGDGLTQGEQKVRSLHLLESQASTEENASIKNRNEGDGTNGMAWSSGTLLAQALTSSFGIQYLRRFIQAETLQKGGQEGVTIRCLELGSGLGACGLALAHALGYCCTSDSAECDTKNSSRNKSASIILTDKGEIAVDLLKKNIQRNLPPSCATIAAESLVWGESLQSKCFCTDEKFHLLLGSDLLYNTRESYDPLIKTIEQYLHPDRGIVLLAVRWRKPDLEREFFQKAEIKGLMFEPWKEFIESNDFEKRSPCRLNWKEYGNPESESSNRHFYETTVSLAKKKAALANITEQDVESMNDEEYSIFEELQVQVYVGKYCGGEKAISRKRQREDG